MTTKVGINGFGRIGRLALRVAEADPDIEIVGINGTGNIPAMAHLLKYDSVQGRCFDTVEAKDDHLIVDGHKIAVTAERDPSNIDWTKVGADVVIESTGLFTAMDKAKVHIDNGGAKKVVISAPGKEVDATIVMGVNDQDYDPERHNVVSNASCTTNCLAPFAKVLVDEFGVKRGYMNTVHAFTNDQRILDRTHKDLRRARTASASIIPTTTGAARAVSLVIPELAGKLDGFATRVPVPDGSMVDLTVELECDVTVEKINAAMKAAADGPMKGILEYITDPVVSVDIIGNPHSSIFDSLMTMVIGGEGNFCKVVAWYDNEWGYSNRVVDLAKMVLQ